VPISKVPERNCRPATDQPDAENRSPSLLSIVLPQIVLPQIVLPKQLPTSNEANPSLGESFRNRSGQDVLPAEPHNVSANLAFNRPT